MLHINNPAIRLQLLKGTFGLELESLRVDGRGRLSRTAHPFPGNERIDRDFSENQTEFNTEVLPNAWEAVRALRRYYAGALKTMRALPEPEYFWPFSNPPALYGDADVPIAQYYGEKREKTEYRGYLARRYGRYKMTFSGIHVNYSFSDELIELEAAACGEDSRTVKDRLYLQLAEKAVAYGWLLTALTAASPVMDESYNDPESVGKDMFSGMASVRCSELGYWNFFAPLLSYESVASHIDSIQRYVDRGLIRQFSELYYPIRLKPKGTYSLSGLRENGINHIELRMVDLNPLVFGCVDERDVEFAQLLLVWLSASDRLKLTENDQVQAVQNFKSAAHYNLDAVQISLPDGTTGTAREVAVQILREMQVFYADAPAAAKDVLRFQMEKLTVPGKSYASRVRALYGKGYLEKGISLANRRSYEITQYL